MKYYVLIITIVYILVGVYGFSVMRKQDILSTHLSDELFKCKNPELYEER